MLQPAAAAEVREKMDAKMDQFIALPGYVPHDILSGAESPSKDYGDCGDSWMWGINYLTRSLLSLRGSRLLLGATLSASTAGRKLSL